jgi:hypothetical protein
LPGKYVHRAIWMAYGSIVWTTPNVVFLMRYIIIPLRSGSFSSGQDSLVYEE